jgi:hypothetical protein
MAFWIAMLYTFSFRFSEQNEHFWIADYRLATLVGFAWRGDRCQSVFR